MPYILILLDEFATWLDDQDEDRRIRIMAHLDLLEERGPLLGRPFVDTLKGSRVSNLKELRLQHKGEPIRILFAFDPKQQADKRWYKTNIPRAETLFFAYLEQQQQADEQGKEKGQ